MNFINKIKKTWWIILSFISMINGFGFIYIGLKYTNKNWVLEGIMYEIPWFFFLAMISVFGSLPFGFNPITISIILGFIIQFVSIIRSIWVAIKLWDVFDDMPDS